MQCGKRILSPALFRGRRNGNKKKKFRFGRRESNPGHSDTAVIALGWQRRVLPLYYNRTVVKGNQDLTHKTSIVHDRLHEPSRCGETYKGCGVFASRGMYHMAVLFDRRQLWLHGIRKYADNDKRVETQLWQTVRPSYRPGF